VFLFEPRGENRYISVPVTLESWEGPNLYAFVFNDPLERTDALGLIAFTGNICAVLEAMLSSSLDENPARHAELLKLYQQGSGNK
jgi:hypothetical protein